MAEPDKRVTRRDFLGGAVRGACLVGVGGTAGLLATRSRAKDVVWQIDPHKCIACGNCATYCVLEPSAVKCVHAYGICGYCELCFGNSTGQADADHSAAEYQLCPTSAISREHAEGPYYEYTINEDLCVGCGKCVQGCNHAGNGALHLQVRHDRCVNCNECSIAAACPSNAFVRVPAADPYLMKDKDRPR